MQKWDRSAVADIALRIGLWPTVPRFEAGPGVGQRVAAGCAALNLRAPNRPGILCRILGYTEDMSDESSSRIGAGDRELLTVEQAAHYLQLSPSSIRSYIRQGKLKAFRVAGLRKVLIPRAALLLLLEPAKRGDDQTPGP